jgi:hypothetical protein
MGRGSTLPAFFDGAEQPAGDADARLPTALLTEPHALHLVCRPTSHSPQASSQ